MIRRSKIERKLRLSKETLRALNAHELGLAAGGTGSESGDGGASSLSGSRKCVWTYQCALG
jgi:hypothetical protein